VVEGTPGEVRNPFNSNEELARRDLPEN